MEGRENLEVLLKDVGNGTENLRFLYFTLCIIVGLLLFWIVMCIYTKESPNNILLEMISIASQVEPVTDI